MLANAIVHRLSQGCLRNALSSGHIRGLSTSRCLRLPNEFDSKPDPVVVKFHSSGQLLPHQQWAIRLSNQNGYLSWCRNAYLSLSVSVAITLYTRGGPLPFDAEVSPGLIGVAHVMLLLSQLNMLFGSGEFIYQLIRTRPLTQMAWPLVALYCLLALAHAYIFIDVFAGMEEPPEDSSVV